MKFSGAVKGDALVFTIEIREADMKDLDQQERKRANEELAAARMESNPAEAALHLRKAIALVNTAIGRARDLAVRAAAAAARKTGPPPIELAGVGGIASGEVVGTPGGSK